MDVQDVQVQESIDDIADLISGMKIQAENNDEVDRDTTPTPQVDEDVEDKANILESPDKPVENILESENIHEIETSVKIEELENKLEELKKENETIETKCKSTEETLSKYKDQTREILRKSKEKITDTVKEKTELAEKLKNTEMELETLKESGSNQFSSQTFGICQFIFQ